MNHGELLVRFSGFMRVKFGTATLALILIVLLGTVLRVLSFGGYHGTDDSGYSLIANAISTGTYFSPDIAAVPLFKLRLGVTVPAAIAFRLFGVNVYSLVAYPFILSLVGIVVAFLIGRLIYDERTGLIAALLAAIVPLDIRLASELQPNLPGAFWANLGMLAVIIASRHKSSRQKILPAVVAGILFGISWLCKSSVVFLTLFVIGYAIVLIFRDRENRAILPCFLVAFFMVLLAEALFHYSYTGDLFYRYNITEENYRLTKTWFFAEGTPFGWNPGSYYEALLRRMFVVGPEVIFLETQFGGFTLAAIIVSLYALIRKRREILFPAAWFFSLVVLFNFGSISFRAYTPLPLFPAHLFPLIMPAVLVTAGLFGSYGSDSGSIEGKPAYGLTVLRIVVILIVIAASCNGFWRNFLDGPQGRLEAAASRIASPTDPVFTDRRSMAGLDFFWGFPDEMDTHDFEGMSAADIPAGSYVLIDRYRLEFLSAFYDYRLPEFYDSVPDAWIKRVENRDGELYYVPESYGSNQSDSSSDPS